MNANENYYTYCYLLQDVLCVITQEFNDGKETGRSRMRTVGVHGSGGKKAQGAAIQAGQPARRPA
ncbi:hypothetical protein C1N58_14710 [Pantoea sp. SGAir0180]|uniref:Uncharacterized protein n=2 Tax=Pantoea stewartii TaxID=66269 RepID=A0AB34VAP0_9GAMM|nr:hypothetical protein DSJ_05860 [Pantoea stewartii subsp. stewartii DC283]KGD83229.1 hypothetical protein HA47_13020 [Pantoea stewartii subsp. indologenes]KHE01766.1 hypothetical protein NL54_08155 [Pantoea stewartii]KKW52115.1 hypothetical protein XB02_02230 [Pantoea ananatis]KHN64316.1 hypothetical protein OI73_04600 [Pantoea stewartii]